MNRYDVVVVGGGMVGSALALGLAKQGYYVSVLESRIPAPFSQEQPADLRVSAISMATVRLLKDLGAWPAIESKRVCPYRRVEAWEYSEYQISFDASELEVDQLGYIAENRIVQLSLWEELATHERATIHCPSDLHSYLQGDNGVEILLSSGEKLISDWIIGADGPDSRVRSLGDIGITAWDYRQHCMLVSIQTSSEQQETTWQQFLPSGPRSFLPLFNHHASLAWYDSPEKITQLSALSPSHLVREIREAFPVEKNLKEINILGRGTFPLMRRHAHSYVRGRAIIIGDAAHTIHPLAGQGANLGFRDVRFFLDLVLREGKLSDKVTKIYYHRRMIDNLSMQTGMDILYNTFSNSVLPLKIFRNVALKIVNKTVPVPIKRALLRSIVDI